MQIAEEGLFDATFIPALFLWLKLYESRKHHSVYEKI